MYDLPPFYDDYQEGPTFMQGPPGSQFISGYAYSPYFDIQPGESLQTLQLDFVTAIRISREQVKLAVDRVLSMFTDVGEEVAAFGLWEREIFDVHIPQQFCFFGHCWTPPWAGTSILTSYEYRIWVLIRTQQLGSLAVRPAPAWPAVIIAVCVAIITLIAVVAAVIGMRTGTTTWPELKEFVEDVLTTPGENVAKAVGGLTWPFAALGLILIGAAIALPLLSTKLGATVPVGPARVTAEARTGRQPATRTTRR